MAQVLTMEKLLKQVDAIILPQIIDELRAQGHYNTGKLEESLESEIVVKNQDGSLEGSALYYALILHHGFGPEKASFKQFPFLVEYFESKGKSEKEAKQYAAMTIRKWMKEGMPTAHSYSYSSNGERLNVISLVKKAVNGKINFAMSKGIDQIVNQKFHETKSETI